MKEDLEEVKEFDEDKEEEDNDEIDGNGGLLKVRGGGKWCRYRKFWMKRKCTRKKKERSRGVGGLEEKCLR